MKKVNKMLAMLLAAILFVGTSMNIMTVSAETGLNSDTVATVGDKEYTKDQFKDAIIASTETNPVVIQKDFTLTEDCEIEGDATGMYVDLNDHKITFSECRICIYKDIPVKIYNGEMETNFYPILNIYGDEPDAEYTSTFEIKDCTLTSLSTYGVALFFETGNFVLDNVTLNGGIETRSDRGNASLTIRNNVKVTKGIFRVKHLIIEKESKLEGQCEGILIGADAGKVGSFTNDGTLDVNGPLIFRGDGWQAGNITNNGMIKATSFGSEAIPNMYNFVNNGTMECTGDFLMFCGLSIENAENATIKIGGTLTLKEYTYYGGNRIINNGTLVIDGNINNNASITNNAKMFIGDNTTISGNEITGTGKVMKIIDTVDVSDLDAPSAGTAFDKEVAVGDSSKYTASVKYYTDDTEDTNENAGYNKIYTAKVTVTPAEGYGFLLVPTATFNGTATTAVLEDDGTVTLDYTFPATAKKMTGIKTPTAITGLPNGTAKDAASLGLPDTVTIETEDTDITTAGVTWDLDNLASGSYDPEVLEEQTFTVNGTVTLPSGVDQNSVSLTVQINVTVSNADTAANVTADVTPGKYSSNQSVTLSTTTSGADIYYTTDGTVPDSTNGMKYTGAVSVTGTEGKDVTTTIKAVAVKNGMYSSEVQSFTYTIRLEGTKPYIEGDNGTAGWDAIEAKINNTEDGTSVIVNMNGTTTVPGNVFDSVKGRDIDIVFEMENGITWTVNGNSVTKDNIGEIDFAVTTGTSTIPVDVVNTVTGEKYSIQISLAYDGEFGFTATLSINMDAKNAGYYANLYYYNKSTGKLEFMNAGKIDKNGNVELTFTHASDYTIVVSDKAMNETETPTIKTPGTTPTETDSPKTGDTSPILLWVLVLISSGIGVTAVASKKRKRETK